MMYGVQVVLKYLLKKDIAGRNFAVFPDDVMLVSYPRSGNTWTRFLLANLVHPTKEISFANIESLIPDTTTIPSRTLKQIPRPRLIKTHEYFDHRYPRVIYIVRDPRDVALSCYDFQRKYRQIPDGYPLETYVDDLIHGRAVSKEYGTWSENVGSWLAARGRSENFFLLRFEDMLARTQSELERVAAFLGVSATPELLQRAVENSAADRMREMEKQQQYEWVGAKKFRKDIPFVRVAKAGGWKENLPANCVRQIEDAWGDLMARLGYKLTSRVSEEPRMSETVLS